MRIGLISLVEIWQIQYIKIKTNVNHYFANIPAFWSYPERTAKGPGFGRDLLRLILPEGQVFGGVLHLLRHGDLLNIVIANDLQSDGIAADGAVLLIFCTICCMSCVASISYFTGRREKSPIQTRTGTSAAVSSGVSEVPNRDFRRSQRPVVLFSVFPARYAAAAFPQRTEPTDPGPNSSPRPGSRYRSVC